ncbi:aspartate/glutamate racemase family protein [Comamonas aquatilis]|uniref:aspartate/glutamate racemase family protein n=1 Tax=Comamonas aquatilis TaxID=1778406 RepID=UPI0039EEA74D
MSALPDSQDKPLAAQILLLNPNTSQQTTALMARQALACLPAGVRLQTATAARGAAMITDEAGLAIAEQEVLRLGREFADADDSPRPCAIIVAAFGNPGLDLLRAALPAQVQTFGIGEAAMLQAARDAEGLPRRFGIATTTPGLEASIAASVSALGLTPWFTGTRIAEGQPLALAADPALQCERLAAAVAACVDGDGAQAVVIGGGPLAEAALWLAPRFAVPVLSPVVAAVQAALKGLQLQTLEQV